MLRSFLLRREEPALAKGGRTRLIRPSSNFFTASKGRGLDVLRRDQPQAGPDASSPLRLRAGFARGDRGFAIEQQPGALDDRHVDHPAVDGDGTHPLGQCLVVSGDDAAGVVELLRARTEFLVQDRHLARMDDRRADKPEPARAADRIPE